VVDSDGSWLEFHVRGEDSHLRFASLLLPHAVERLRDLVWTLLDAHCGSCVVGLVQLPSVLVGGVSGTFGDRPMRSVLVETSEGTFLGVVGSWANYFGSWVEFNQWVKSFDCSTSVKTVAGLDGNLWLEIWEVFWARSNFISLGVCGKLYECCITLASPPNLVLPLKFLVPLSASLISS
jgi:hypothetical protein